MTEKTNLKKLTVTGMICALAFLVTFALRFKVSFLTFDLKDAIIAVASLLYGPVYGVASALVVALLEFITVSDTGLYGLIMNFLSSGTFALVCGIIYKYRRTFSGAVMAVVFAVLGTVCVMLVANMFITPFYMGVSRSDVIGLIPGLLLPFNLCKATINASVTMLIYKPVTRALRRAGVLEAAKYQGKGLRSAVVSVVCVAVLALAVLFFILKLDGAFEIF